MQNFFPAWVSQIVKNTSSALHPDSEVIPVSRANGILTAYVQPYGGLISGQGCAIQLQGWVPREMVQADPVALNVTVPRHVPRELDSARSRGDGPDAFNGEDPS